MVRTENDELARVIPYTNIPVQYITLALYKKVKLVSFMDNRTDHACTELKFRVQFQKSV